MKNHLNHSQEKMEDCCIDEMDALLDQIADFKKLIRSPHKVSDSGFLQEYRLFKQHIRWVSEDLTSNSFIIRPKPHSKY